MANVLFLRGMQANVPLGTNGNAKNGAFYLTEDTNRLYVGIGDNKPAVLLNQTVNFIDSTEDLGALANSWTTPAQKAAHVQDLYYIKNDNILAVYLPDGDSTYKWKQINPDTDVRVKNIKINATQDTTNNKATIKNTIVLTNDTHTENSFEIKGSKTADGKKTIQIEAADANADGTTKAVVTFTGDVFTLGTSAISNGAKINLTSTFDNDSSVNIISGTNTTVSRETNGDIKISSKNWIPTEAESSLKLNTNGTLTIKVSDGTNGITESTGVLGVKVGGEQGTAGTLVPLGQDLNVYTKDQIESKIKQLNGMTYRGTIGNNSDTVAMFKLQTNFTVNTQSDAASPVHNGDTYKVTTNNLIYDSDDHTAKIGDLLIATGTEGADGTIAAPVWTLVPSGDDSADSFTKFVADAANNKLNAETWDTGGKAKQQDAGSIQIKASTETNGAIQISSTATEGKNLVVTVKHKEMNFTGNAGPDASASSSITAITAIQGDGHGHVAGYTTTKFNLPTYSLSYNASAESSSKAATFNTILKKGDSTSSTVSHKITSNTLTMTAAGNVVNIDLTWGTF